MHLSRPIQRKRKHLCLVFTLLLTDPSSHAVGANMTAEIWDVIIVGAGLSGLSAAHLLKKRNSKLRILILEGKGW